MEHASIAEMILRVKFNAEVYEMEKLRTIAGLLVGITLGIALGISFKSIVVGLIAGACFSILFGYTFNTVNRKKDE